jgi:hypothetical protein
MKTSSHLSLRIAFILLLPVVTAASPAPEFEEPPTLPAQDLAPASLLSGNGFHVNNEVPTEGYLGHFIIHSDVGTFKANSLEMLRIRVAELPAIMELTKTSKTKVFAQALATNAAAPVAAAPVRFRPGASPSVGFQAAWGGSSVESNRGGRRHQTRQRAAYEQITALFDFSRI